MSQISRVLTIALFLQLLVACGANSPFQKDEDTPDSDTPSKTLVNEIERGIPTTAAEDEMVGQDPLSNLSTLLYQQNLNGYHRKGFTGKGIKIAILDNGFAGLNHSKGQRLPPGTRTFEAPGNAMANTPHGTKLAEIVYALATGSAQYSSSIEGPEMLLLNTNGFTNLVHAIDTVIAEKVDIVLYAQVWEYGGNFDGGGFINKEVNRAINSGVLWVNAAGNLGQATWNGPVIPSDFGTIDLPYKMYQDSPNSFLRFTVPQEFTDTKIVVSWNDFTDDKSYKTPQDLNVELLDSKNQVLDGGYLVQTGLKQSGSQYSIHAREIIHASLNTGTYKIRVLAGSKNFDAKSIMRVTVNGLGVRLIEKSLIPTVLIPAENHEVLTIGAVDVDYSGLTNSKPEARMRSEVRFGAGETYYGTSAATAIATGSLAVLFSSGKKLKKSQVDQMIHSGELQRNLSLPDIAE